MLDLGLTFFPENRSRLEVEKESPLYSLYNENSVLLCPFYSVAFAHRF